MRIVCMLLLAGLFVGCTKFNERHYFKSVNFEKGEAVNYYRLEVKGNAGLSSARYVAGYYDERAVDLFFNELRSGPVCLTENDGTCSATNGSRKLFVDAQKSPGKDEIIAPLDPNQHGVFVMIMSTNADAVANTIGSFAENSVAADAITNLLNHDKIRESRRSIAILDVARNRATAFAGELEDLFGKVPTDGDSVPATKGAYIDVLNAITRALGAPQEFTDFTSAREWFIRRKSDGGGN